jgi:hypothetical protein
VANWWEQDLFGTGQNAGDVALGAATGGLWNLGKFAVQQGNGDPFATALTFANPIAGMGLSAATGGFGAQDAAAAQNASQAQLDYLREAGAGAQQAGQQAQQGLDPYAQAGQNALQQQQALSGALGPEAYQAAVAALQAGPQYQGMVQQGEEAILANASATGGLRGGNTQAALAQFRPQMLSQVINDQYARLAGLSSGGQQAATQQGAFGLNGAGMNADILGQQGAAAAGGILGQQAALSGARNQITNWGMQGAGLAAKAIL